MTSEANRRLRPLIYIAVVVIAIATANGIAGVLSGSWHEKGLISDFAHFWVAARMALAGHAGDAYDPAKFVQALLGAFDERALGLFWLYPPQGFWLYLPFAPLSYATAYIAFMLATFAALMASLWAAGRWRPELALCLALSPAVLVAAAFGQNGLWTSALLIVIAFARDERPVLAGIAIGLLTMKPQFGVLIPFVLLIERNWVCFAAALVSTLVLLAVTTLWFGAGIWQAYVSIFSLDNPVVREMGQHMGALTWQISPFAGFQSAGLGRTASALAALVVALAAGWALYLNRHLADRPLKAALFIAATFLAAPYTGIYDLAALAFASLALLFREADKHEPSLVVMLVSLAAFGLPAIGQRSAVLHMPVAAFVLAAFALVVARLAQGEARRSLASPA